MGFLKRIFSIGSKKHKKRSPQISQHSDEISSGLRSIQEEDYEAAASRLLRSSSARFAVVSELDYASLPPLPHPINHVIQTPAASTISLASTSTNQRGTYTVTVHRREHHALTEFPNANRDLDDQFTTPQHPRQNSRPLKDSSQIIGLRSDPSVVSLLNMYDEHGRLPSRAFSNTPPSPGREAHAQKRRSGSTFRELLGNPSSLNARGRNVEASTLEGDISWAERFLGETESISSTSSLGLCIPNDTNAHLSNDPLCTHNVHNDNTFSTHHDLSRNTSGNPAISSLEVEVSIVAESPPLLEYPYNNRHNPYRDSNSMTPKRASQVFGFLTNRRRSRQHIDTERPLPELPSTFSSPSDENSQPGGSHSHFSSDTSSGSISVNSKSSAIPIPSLNDTPSCNYTLSDITHLDRTPSLAQLQSQLPPPSRSRFSSFSSQFSSNACNIIESMLDNPPDGDTVHESPKLHPIKVIMTAPTKVIVTAPTPSDGDNVPTTARILRGPRAQANLERTMQPSKDSHMFGQCSNTESSRSQSQSLKGLFTPMPSRRRRSHHRTTSRTSSSTLSLTEDVPLSFRPAVKVIKSQVDRGGSILAAFEKENHNSLDLGLSATSKLPITPTRSNSGSSSRAFFRSAVNPTMFRPPIGMTPSPASSSELSPVGQRMMMGLRKQRMRAREADREKSNRGGRFGSGMVGNRV